MTFDPSQLPPEVVEVFREEVRGLLSQAATLLDGLRESVGEGARAQALDALRRLLHNVKGTASSLGFSGVAVVAHAAEDVVGGLEYEDERARALDDLVVAMAWIQRSIEGVDADPTEVLARLNRPAAHEAAPATTAVEVRPERPERPSPPRSAQLQPDDVGSVRVSHAALEELFVPVATLVTDRSEGRYHLEQLRLATEVLRTMWRRAGRAALSSEDITRMDQALAVVERRTAALDDGVRRSSLALTHIEEQLGQIRMVKVASLTDELGLTVRDAAIRCGKEVRFDVEAGDVGLDRRDLQGLKPALVHLLRNAVDHGLEAPAERRRRGKPQAGRISLRVAYHHEYVDVTVADDGGGLDVQAVRDRAVAQGLIDEERAARLTPPEFVDILARTGFSTASTVTELSGRGVGMDVVRRFVEGRGGRLSMSWTAGAGMQTTLSLPTSMLTTRVLLVQHAEQTYAVPLSAIRLTVRIVPDEVFVLDGRPFIDIDGTVAALEWLGGRAPLSQVPAKGRMFAVLLETEGRAVAIVVDEILGEDEVVVRPFGPPARRIPGLLGTTVSEAGAVALVVNPRDLTSLLTLEIGGREVQEAPRPAPRILIVDDSVTTRTLERHILESRGYSVRSACDGQEALDMLRAERPDLVISDVEMPRVNGLELVRAIRANEKLAGLPVILLTSLRSAEDQRRIAAVGAQAYLKKTEFDQETLVDTIERLLRGGGRGD